MSEFFVKSKQLSEEANRLSNIAQSVAGAKKSVSSIGSALNNRILRSSRYSSSLKNSFENISGKLETTKGDIDKLSEALDNISHLYENKEEEITGYDNGEQKSLWYKLTNGGISDAVVSGSRASDAVLLGINAFGSVEGSVLGGSAGVKTSGVLKWNTEKPDEKDLYASIVAEANGHVAHGKVNGNFGILSGEAEADLFSGSAKGEAGINIMKDGKFDPSLYAKISADVAVLSGATALSIGSEYNNVHANANGKVLSAEAEAGIQVGKVTNAKTGKVEDGVSGEFSVGAAVAKGSVSGGVTVFGIKIDATLKGEVLAVGAEGKASVTESGFEVGLKGSAGIGGGVDISVDWSGVTSYWKNLFG